MRSVKQRVLALLLTAAMLCTYVVPAFAAETADPAVEADPAGQTEYTYTELSKDPMKASVKASSEEKPGNDALVNQWNDGLAKAAFDGNTATCWHSNYAFGNNQHGEVASCNFTIDWDLKADQSAVQVGRLKYQTKTPKQDNGQWKTIEILATVNGQEQSVFKGDITLTGGVATVDFTPVNATHMKVVITQSIGDKNGGNNDNKFAAAGEITVYEATPVVTYTFALDQSEVSLEKDATKKLKWSMTGSDNNTVTDGVSVAWAAESGKFVEVAEDGTVTAKAAGTERVTATATYKGETYTATCDVTVTETPVAAGAAEVAGKTYDTLHAAFAAAQAGETVKVLRDVTFGVDKDEVREPISVDKAVTLDLNGKTIIGSVDNDNGESESDPNAFNTVFFVEGTGDLTIQDTAGEGKDGKIIGRKLETRDDTSVLPCTVVKVDHEAKLTVHGGTLIGEYMTGAVAAAQGYAVDFQWGHDRIENATILIDGGKLIGVKMDGGMVDYGSTHCAGQAINVNDGDVTVRGDAELIGMDVTGNVIKAGATAIEKKQGTINVEENAKLTGLQTDSDVNRDCRVSAIYAPRCEINVKGGQLVGVRTTGKISNQNKNGSANRNLKAMSVKGYYDGASTVNLAGGEVTGAYAAGVENGYAVGIVIDNATVNVDGAEVNGVKLTDNAGKITGKSVVDAFRNTDRSVLNVKKGTINGAVGTVEADAVANALEIEEGTVSVTGGVWKGSAKEIALGQYATPSDCHIEVNGGVFAHDFVDGANDRAYLAEGATTERGDLTGENWTASESGNQYKVLPGQEKVTVTFMNGDAVAATRKVVPNTELGEVPAAPQAPAGKVFKGWFDAEGNKAEASTVITENTTFTAKFGLEEKTGRNINFYAYVNGEVKLVANKTDVTVYWYNNRQQLSAELLESVYGEFGFTAEQLTAGTRYFPNTNRNDGTIWGDCVAVEIDGKVYQPTVNIPTTTDFDVYYLPKQTVTGSSSKTDATVVGANNFYTVTIENGDPAEVKYFLNNTNAVVTVDNAPEGKVWTCTGKDNSTVDGAVAEKTTFTINKIAQPYTVKQKSALNPVAAVVAQDGKTQEYNTLHEAVAAAQAGQTVKLLADVTFGANTEEEATIEVSQKLVFDLNGFTVTGNGTVFNVNENGDLTVQDSTENHAGKIVGVVSDSTLENPAAKTICALGNAKVTVLSGEVWGACAKDIDGAGNLNAIYVDTNATLQVAGNAVVGAAKAENNALNTNYTAVYNMGTTIVTDNAKVVGVQAVNKVSTEQMFGMNLGLDAINSANSLTVSGNAQVIGVAGKDLNEAEARAIQAKGDLVLEGGRVEGKGAYGAVLTTDAKLVVRAGKNGEIPVVENVAGPALTMSTKYPNATQNITAGIFKIPAVSEKFTELKDAVAEGYTTEQGNLAGDKWTVAEDGAYLKVVEQTFDVIFKSGDKVIEIRTFKAGQKLGELPQNPEMDGYVFKGWTDDNGNGVTAETVVNSDMVIVARFNKVFDVTIEDKTYQIEAGQTLGDRLPANPEKDGYVFKGWKDSKGNVVTAETVVNDNMTIKAEYNELFEVVIDGKTYEVEKGETLGDRLPADPTKDGYTFKGWKDQNGKKVNKDTVVNGDMTVTSVWKQNPAPKPTPDPDPKPNPNPPAPDGGNNSKPAAGGATATGDTTNLFGWMTLASLMAAGAAVSFKKLRGNK